MAFGRNDPRDTFSALYSDDRGVARVYGMTFADGEWTLLREDPDFHQRMGPHRRRADRVAGGRLRGLRRDLAQ